MTLKSVLTYLKRDNKRVTFISLSILMFLALYVRLLFSSHSLWLDELTTAWVVGASFLDIFERCWANNLSPLYYCIIYASKSIFGYSEFGLRLPGIIAGVLTVLVGFKVSKIFTKSIFWSLIVALLIAFTPNLIYFSLEVRPYSFVILIALIHIKLFFDFINRLDSIALALMLAFLSGVLVLLHYTSASLMLVELLIAPILLEKGLKFSRREYLHIALQVLIPLVLISPFLGHLYYLFIQNEILGSFIEKVGIVAIITHSSELLYFVLVPLVFAVIVDFFITKKDYHIHINKKTISLILLFFLPLILHWFITEIGIATIFLSRYVAWTIVLPIIASVVVCKGLKSKISKLVFISLILLYIFIPYVQSMQSDHRLRNQGLERKLSIRGNIVYDWKEAVNYTNTLSLDVNKVYVTPGLVETKMESFPLGKEELYQNYLLCTINSLYLLKESYRKKAIAINNVGEIPVAMKNYLVIGTSDIETSDKFIELNKESSNTTRKSIYYVE
jgi:hypothetical protein